MDEVAKITKISRLTFKSIFKMVLIRLANIGYIIINVPFPTLLVSKKYR